MSWRCHREETSFFDLESGSLKTSSNNDFVSFHIATIHWKDLTTLTAADQLEYKHLVTVNMFLLLSVFFLPAVLVHCADTTPVNLNIAAPKELEAVAGSCLIIPCIFTPAPGKKIDNRRKLFAVWIKDEPPFKDHLERIVFNSSNAVNYPHISIIGNLKERNCTTKFDGVMKPLNTKFFFRIENGPFMATAISDPVHIKLEDSPLRPRLNVSGDLKEKESVTITCSAPTPCPHSPPRLSWSLPQDAHSQTEQNTDGTFTTKIQENFTLSDQHDGLNINCSAVFPLDGGKHVKTSVGKLTLSVSYAPKDTTASISRSGSWKNLSCSSRAKPAVSFTWFKTSDRGPIRVSEGQFYTFNVSNVTDTESFYCVAQNALGNQTSSWIQVDKAESSVDVIAAVAVSVSIVFICLVFSVWRFKKRPTPPQTQTGSVEEFSGHMAADEAERDVGGEEELHYQSVRFSQQRTEALTVSVQDATQREECLYAQVKVHQPENSSAPAAGVSEDLYAQVKRK